MRQSDRSSVSDFHCSRAATFQQLILRHPSFSIGRPFSAVASTCACVSSFSSFLLLQMFITRCIEMIHHPYNCNCSFGNETSTTVLQLGDGISTLLCQFGFHKRMTTSLILSPLATNHFKISPSWIPSPISGKRSSNAM